MLEFSEIEAGYIISQQALEQSVGYRYEEKPEFFEFYRAYPITQRTFFDETNNSPFFYNYSFFFR